MKYVDLSGKYCRVVIRFREPKTVRYIFDPCRFQDKKKMFHRTLCKLYHFTQNYFTSSVRVSDFTGMSVSRCAVERFFKHNFL